MSLAREWTVKQLSEDAQTSTYRNESIQVKMHHRFFHTPALGLLHVLSAAARAAT